MLFFFSLLAVASAAPQYYHDNYYHRFHNPPHQENGLMDPFFKGNVFDTRSFWEEMSREMQQLDDVLQEFTKYFPSTAFSARVEGDAYKITVALDGYEESDIKVKANNEVLMIQATHSSDDGHVQRTYMDLRSLPKNVSPNGNWSYEGGVLRIVFPLKSEAVTPQTSTESATEVLITTKAPVVHSREQIESNEDNSAASDIDADVGLNHQRDNDILTNEIPRKSSSERVEATTYAVDLNNLVEFVPVRY